MNWVSAWCRYQAAAGDLEDRDARLAELYKEAELGLELVGVTAIEDKLQDGVPESIHTLLQAGIKVNIPCHMRPSYLQNCIPHGKQFSLNRQKLPLSQDL